MKFHLLELTRLNGSLLSSYPWVVL